MNENECSGANDGTCPKHPEVVIEFEVYVEKFMITELRDGAVWGTRSLGCGWFPEQVVKGNTDTTIMYVAASDEFARTHSTIRRRKRS